ncbi:MAG: hypothetical protein UV17_C0045G0021 [Candidatus Gottesmanbacteria bacterium GW2011_GWA1_42_26]|nr:MAG: hypothetical protein UV17_C0045G0021 [Candidatus Gottesmanbacteria bacterium GW2011_GWA1_42_26]
MMSALFGLRTKRHLIIVVSLLVLALVFPSSIFAFSRADYFDWGPYYGPDKQVLGVTYSAVENLPPITTPKLMPAFNTAGVLPGNPLAFFDTFAENVQLTFTFDPIARGNLRLSFADERVSEIKALVSQDKPYLASVTGDNYETLMQDLGKDLPILAKSADPAALNLLSQVESNIASHNIAFQDLSFTSPPKMTEALKDALSASEDSMDALADATDAPPISDGLSGSIQTLKEQGLLTPEEANKLYAYDSRSEVRRELNKLVGSGEFPAAEVLKMNESVDKKFPEAQDQIAANYTVIELRSYETRPQPTTDILNQIDSWKKAGAGTPPPSEIRPYLYYERAQDVAKNIDLTHFPPETLAEIAKLYPEAIGENSTYSSPPLATPPPTFTPSPLPSLAPGELKLFLG